MSYTEEFIRQCQEEGIERRVWLVIADRVYVAPDIYANHEDLFGLLEERGVGMAGFDWRSAPQGDIMNGVARGPVEWLERVREAMGEAR